MNIKISIRDKAKYTFQITKILEKLKGNPERQNKLIDILKSNGFEDIAALAEDAKKYLQ